MKKLIIISVLLILTVESVFAVNLSLFNGSNYMSTRNYCGSHIEVSGNKLIMTQIIPPNINRANANCNIYRNCNGVTYILNCDKKSGRCFNEFGQNIIILLSDGNYVNTVDETKHIYHNSGEYFWCPNE